MSKQIKQLVNTEIRVTGEIHPCNRNEWNESSFREEKVLQRRIKKKCSGCGDQFSCYRIKDYYYCLNCAINNNRYATNKCHECGDGSGIIKFANQPPRACKLCYLTQPKPAKKKSAMNNLNLNFEQKIYRSSYSLAKCTDVFYLHGNNYFVYTCQNGHKQIKPGKQLNYE